jgi:hypothetical protein
MVKLSSGLAVLTVSLGIGACSKSVSLEEAIDCSQFERSSTGAWKTKTSVSLNYTRGLGKVQDNFGPGTTIKGAAGSEDALIEAALEKKCAP